MLDMLRAPDLGSDEAETWIDEVSGTRFVLFVWAVLLVFYLPVSLTFGVRHIDPLGNDLTAWAIADAGTPAIDSFAGLETELGGDFQPGLPRIRPTDRGPLSQYPPGAAITGLPVYVVADALGFEAVPIDLARADGVIIPTELPPRWIGAVAGSLITAAAGAFVALGIADVSSRRIGLLGGLLFGLGTTAWSVASTDLWMHGPAMLWLAVGVVLARRERDLGAGLALAIAVLVRPHTALVAAAIGLTKAWNQRSLRPAVTIGASSALGVVAVVLYNKWGYGSYSITGGYGSGQSDSFSGGSAASLVDFVTNISGGLVDPERGLLIYAPFLVALAPGIKGAWQRSDAVTRGAAIGGVLYLLVQWKANRFSGGSEFWAYRYPLEMLAVSASLGALAWHSLDPAGAARRWFKGLCLVAVLFQIFGLALLR